MSDTDYLNDVDFDAAAAINAIAKETNDRKAIAAARHDFVQRQAGGSAVTRASVLLSCAADVAPESIVWLWPGWLPAGKLTLLAGSPGTGKTTLAIALAACVTTAGSWPDGSHCSKAGHVLMWSGEDDLADTLVPRFMAAGADLRKVHFVRSVSDKNGELQPFDPSHDIPLLGERLSDLGRASLLIVDPIVSAVSGDVHRANDVRRNLQALVDMAAAHQCAVLGISHFAKGTKGSSPAERVIGSQAFVALARMVLVAGKDEVAERRILARAKSNIARDDGGVSYSLEQIETNGIEASRVVWGEQIEGTARDILGDVEETDSEKGPREEGKDFLLGLLADGPVSARELKKDADGAGFSWPTIHRAASELGVEKRKLGMKEGWVWALPKISAEEDFRKISTRYTVKSSEDRDIFRSRAGLRAVDIRKAVEDFTAQGVQPSQSYSPSDATDDDGGDL
jgi:putative DNA primase/helicase